MPLNPITQFIKHRPHPTPTASLGLIRAKKNYIAFLLGS